MDKKETTLMQEIGSWIMVIVTAVILAFFIKTFIFNTVQIDGPSMNPTLENGDRLITLKLHYFFKSPTRGDVIVFKSPIEPGKEYIKRVIGVEGDEVRIEDGLVYVNGKKVEETYIEEDIYTFIQDTDRWKVSKDMIFVLGDNRQVNKSIDSRYFGEIPVSSVDGQGVFRYYPFNKIGLIH
ncbi:MAG: signal peptidase I [Bacillota bacterium]|nr:signal peptidase I [Bacillota bacterium]